MRTPEKVLEWQNENETRKREAEREKVKFEEFRAWVKSFVPEGFVLGVREDYTGELTHNKSSYAVYLDQEFFKSMTPKNARAAIRRVANDLEKDLEEENAETNGD